MWHTKHQHLMNWKIPTTNNNIRCPRNNYSRHISFNPARADVLTDRQLCTRQDAPGKMVSLQNCNYVRSCFTMTASKTSRSAAITISSDRFNWTERPQRFFFPPLTVSNVKHRPFFIFQWSGWIFTWLP